MYAESGCTFLQYLQELHAGDATESVAAGDEFAALEIPLDVVPMPECLGDGDVSLRICFLKATHRLVREYDAPTESAVGAVSLDHGDVPRRGGLLGKDCKIETRWTAAHANHPHSAEPRPPGRLLIMV